jgi:hypothetical protein
MEMALHAEIFVVRMEYQDYRPSQCAGPVCGSIVVVSLKID